MPREKRAPLELSQEPDFLSAGANAFDLFIDSIPADGETRVSIRRTPSDLHPNLTMKEDLFPAPAIGPFDAIKEEVARRHGPGEYSLTVAYFGPGGRTDRKLKTVAFRIGATADLGSPERLEELPPPALTSMDQLRETLTRAAQTRAEAAELDATARLAGVGAGPPAAPAPDLVKMFSEMAGLLKSLMPPAQPALGASDSTAMVATLKELVSFAREMMPAGDGPQSFWAVALPHLVDLLKSCAPYLPHIAAAVAQAKQIVATMPAPALGVVAVPETASSPKAPGVPDVVLAPLTGGNPMLESVVKAFLDMAIIECRKEPAPETLKTSYDLLAGYGDVNFPGLLDYLAGLPAEGVYAAWSRLDARLASEPHAKAFVEGFHTYLRPDPEKD